MNMHKYLIESKYNCEQFIFTRMRVLMIQTVWTENSKWKIQLFFKVFLSYLSCVLLVELKEQFNNEFLPLPWTHVVLNLEHL